MAEQEHQPEEGRRETSDGEAAYQELMRLLNQAVKQNRAVMVVTCKVAYGKGYEVDHVRFNCDNRDTAIVMLGQLIEMVVEGTNTPLTDVLKALRYEVAVRRKEHG